MPARLSFIRRGNPVWFGQTQAGGYFGSLPGQLPGKPQAVTDDHAGVIVFSGGTVLQRAIALGELAPRRRPHSGHLLAGWPVGQPIVAGHDTAQTSQLTPEPMAPGAVTIRP
jgi:hypothetical protein